MNYFKCNYTQSWFPLNYYNKEGNPVTILLHDEDKNMYIGVTAIELPKDDNIESISEKEAEKLLKQAIKKNTKW